MTAVRIDPQFDPELIARSKGGESTRELAEWLSTDKGVTGCSHATVARRLMALRAKEAIPANLSFKQVLREVDAALQAMRNLDEEMEAVAEAARLPPDDPRREGLATWRLMTTKRQQLLLAQFKYLTSRQFTLFAIHQEQQHRLQDAMDAETFEDMEALRIEREQLEKAPAPKVREKSSVQAPAPVARTLPKEPERNRPCPCGSGRKYKKCHGSSVNAGSGAFAGPQVEQRTARADG